MTKGTAAATVLPDDKNPAATPETTGPHDDDTDNTPVLDMEILADLSPEYLKNLSNQGSTTIDTPIGGFKSRRYQFKTKKYNKKSNKKSKRKSIKKKSSKRKN